MERRTGLILAALTLFLLAMALARPLSVDESQYVAATALAARGLVPYRDFAYLQTPLQPLVFAPLQWIFAGHLLLAMRLMNALLSSAVTILVYIAGRRMGAREGAALVAAALLIACESFAWCTGVARNDVLPAALMSVGLLMLARPGSARMAAAGLMFGLAASAKISYAAPLATAFFAIAWTNRKQALWFGCGLAIGLLPTLIFAAFAPRAFLAEAIVFPATAPAQYYTAIGQPWRLGPWRFIQLLEAAAIGPALIAAIEVGRRNWWGDPVRRILLAAALGGLISAGLNKPFQIFYLMPALPPLFVLVALLLDEPRPRWLTGAWALFVGIGFVPTAAWFAHGRTPALEADRNASVLAAELRSANVQGPVATLAGQYVEPVDPRFAAGPFLYRTNDFVSDQQARVWHIVTGGELRSLAEQPPAAIVTGTYPDSQAEDEKQLAREAQEAGYRSVATAGGFTIWKRP